MSKKVAKGNAGAQQPVGPAKVAPHLLMGNNVVYHGQIDGSTIDLRKQCAFLYNITCPSNPKAQLPSGKVFIHVSGLSRDRSEEFVGGAGIDFLIVNGRANRPCAKRVNHA